ncbi:unnamed protein product [Cyprideis torosa]|uniref:SLC12A transporter C-terminal domain-containing protein n=1 Tax=Cyprideis torosa TaxID=163714 RepID=A0A7R8ZN01_9CRUS|nr:unnamed protein product [Cyprideis torosa]CAG0896798.1 unnamed protein product [Cyprideis torosa]
MLDSRKSHVKFWRPQMLLMVANPRGACPLISFTNDLKKSGLYVLGHVKVGSLDDESVDPSADDHSDWLSLIDHLKIKAFVEVTLAPSVREGMHHLIRLSGLGAMKPNTILLGFYDSLEPPDFFQSEKSDTSDKGTSESGKNDEASQKKHEVVRSNRSAPRRLPPTVAHSCLKRFVSEGEDRRGTVVQKWKPSTVLRVFLCISSSDQSSQASRETQLRQLLRILRIRAIITLVRWDQVKLDLQRPRADSSSVDDLSSPSSSEEREVLRDGAVPPKEYLRSVNQLILQNSKSTAVTFLYLQKPPAASVGQEGDAAYLKAVNEMTQGLPPTLLVHGASPVQKWKPSTVLRVFLCISSSDQSSQASRETQLRQLLRILRIRAIITLVRWDQVKLDLQRPRADSSSVDDLSSPSSSEEREVLRDGAVPPKEYLRRRYRTSLQLLNMRPASLCQASRHSPYYNDSTLNFT